MAMRVKPMVFLDGIIFTLTGASDLASSFLHPGCFWMAYQITAKFTDHLIVPDVHVYPAVYRLL